jgi:peptidoglycan/xylan/chitin deacetylase (PgdA/CDA1 family)
VALNGVPKYRSHLFFLFLSGIIVLIISVLVYLLILKSVYGRFNTAQLIPDLSSAEDLLFGSSPQVAILSSDYTKNMLPDESTWQKENLKTWQKFFNNISVKHDVISDQQIEAGDHFKYKILVLSGSKSLSDEEIVNIKKYLEQGGSIFATGGTASFSDDGKWRGWQFLSDVFGIRQTKEIGHSDKTKIHTLRGGLPLTSNISAGFPLSIAVWDRPVAAEVLDPRTTQVSFWYNHKLEDGLVREGIKQTAGIVYGNYGEGRFVWMGFEINSILGLQQDYIVFERLFNNCVNWLIYNPIAFIRDWPNGFKSAAVIVPMVSGDISNLKNLLPVIQEEKIKPTFFVESYLAEQKIIDLKQISSYGEIAAIVNLSFISYAEDETNKLYNFNDQLKNLESSKSIFESITGKTVTGMYPLLGNYDENTIKASIKSGFKYFLTDSLNDRSVPKALIRGDERITSVTKTARDDKEVIRDFGLTQNEFQFYSYQEDIDRIAFEGGLFVFKIHSQYQCAAENVAVVKDVIEELKNKHYWIATLSEVQEWYDKRDYVELRTQKRGSSRIVITITNYGVSNINDLVLDVDINEKATNITLSSEIIGTKMAKYNHQDGEQFINLYIDELKKGESRTYYIDYDKVNT